MIKDRGNIKWTALLLSEHRDALRKLKDEEREQEKPVLDEQEVERIGWIIQEAIRKNKPVKLRYHQNKRFHEVEGLIKKIDYASITVGSMVILISNIVNVNLG